jgi:hypothetical protein
MNYYILLIFAPLLILTGLVGLVIPREKSLTSGAPAYNVFHIVFGVIGILLVGSRCEPCIRAFNIGFGVIDLYQIAASRFDLFPKKYFGWTLADDILHAVIGIALIVVGVFAG